jgi:Phage integrase family
MGSTSPAPRPPPYGHSADCPLARRGLLCQAYAPVKRLSGGHTSRGRRAQHGESQSGDWESGYGRSVAVGNEICRRVKDIRTAFDNVVLKAHAVKVVRGHAGRVSAENRCRRREIDLHIHDLRHEAGSRKLEAGWPLHAVSRWLGHTNLETTAKYLNVDARFLYELNDRPALTLVHSAR